MKAYGYTKDGERLTELKEVTLSCSLEELEKLVAFVKIAQERHAYFAREEGDCHTHFRDWDKEWDKSSSDFILFTPY